eukprot:GHRR01030430.1.p1 GENE.GHRR01030430.1~~GHRR01030430.1.p1  ORF type:complete len:171 (+),score=34.52 GHRR01030430.1:201-713(+)
MLYVMGLMPLLEQIRTTARCTLYHLAASWRITSNVQQLGAHLLPGNCPNQQFATAANTQQGLPLKAALRQLYKRVHPDLFTGYPVEQVGMDQCLHQITHWCNLMVNVTLWHIMLEASATPSRTTTDSATAACRPKMSALSSFCRTICTRLAPPGPAWAPPAGLHTTSNST